MSGWIGGFLPLPSGPQTTPTPDQWLRPFAEPVRTTAKWAAVALVASGAFAPVLNPNTQITQNFESRWHQPWSEPIVKTRPLLHPSQQQFLAFAPMPPIVPPVAHVPGPTVVYAYTFQYQAQTKPVFVPTPTTLDRWFVALSEPPKARVTLVTAGQQTTAFVQAAPFAEAVFESKWHQAWSEPVRIRNASNWPQYQQAAAIAPFVPPVFSGAWYTQWQDPVRTRPALLAAQQLAYVRSTFTPPTELITLDKWYVALSEPPKVKVSLSAAGQQYAAFVKAAPFPETTFESKWHYAWAEPVRQKLGLWAAHQAAQVYWSTLTPPNVLTMGWFTPLAPPPNPKQGLAARYQLAFAAPSRLLPTPNITGVLAATETKDVGLFGGILFNRPSTATVGVIQLSFSPITAIVEQPLTVGVSGVSQDTVYIIGGIPTVSIASAAVAIREI